MDESFQYHIISCSYYENARYNIFGQPCDSSYDLNLWGLTLKRTYHYAGSLSSFLFKPFFLLYPHIITQRILGVVFFLMTVACVVRLEKNNQKLALGLFLINFPIIYQFICDTGPVRYSFFILFLSPLIAIKIIQSQKLSQVILGNIFLGSLWFFALEDKPFFIYLVPCLGFLVLAYTYENHQINQNRDSFYKVVFTKLGLTIITFVSLAAIYLFFSETITGASYFTTLKNSVSAGDKATTNLFAYLINFQYFSHRVYGEADLKVLDNIGLFHYGFRYLNIALSIGIWIYAMFIAWPEIKNSLLNITTLFQPSKTKFLVLAAIANISCMQIAGNAWAGHHYVFLHGILMLLVLQVLSTTTIQRQTTFLKFYFLFSLYLAVQLVMVKPKIESNWERYVIFDYLKQPEIAQNFIINHMSWGAYYPSALYGHPDQLVTLQDTFDDDVIENFKDISQALDRELLMICNTLEPKCDRQSLEAIFKGELSFKRASLPIQEWKVFLSERSSSD